MAAGGEDEPADLLGDVQVAYTVAHHYDIISAHRALHESLERAGICTTRTRPSISLPAVQVRIDSWADLVRPG